MAEITFEEKRQEYLTKVATELNRIVNHPVVKNDKILLAGAVAVSQNLMRLINSYKEELKKYENNSHLYNKSPSDLS